MQTPHVRETIADRELETWVLVDLSASLDFGTADCEKRDLAVAAVAAVGLPHRPHRQPHRRRHPRRAERADTIPARSRAHQPPGAAAPGRRRPPRPSAEGATDLAGGLRRLDGTMRRRGLAVVVSDFLAPDGWERPLRALGARHEVLAVEVVDPRELELPDVGVLELVDPETGDIREVNTANRALRERYAARPHAQREPHRPPHPRRRRRPPGAAHRPRLAARPRPLRRPPPRPHRRPAPGAAHDRRRPIPDARSSAPDELPLPLPAAARCWSSPRSSALYLVAADPPEGLRGPVHQPRPARPRSRPASPGWRRHVPAALFLLALATLIVGFAQPTHETQVPRERATVILAIDTSLSMEADDVAPSRLEAAKAAAASFVDVVPAEDQRRPGAASTASPRSGCRPTTDRDAVRRGIDDARARRGHRHRRGDLHLPRRHRVRARRRRAAPRRPARIVLMSDGATTSAAPTRSPPQAAIDAGVPVSTIAFGTDDGTIADPATPWVTVPVPSTATPLETIATETDGTFFEAATEGELRDVYQDIGSSIGYTTEEVDAIAWFIGARPRPAAGHQRPLAGLVQPPALIS